MTPNLSALSIADVLEALAVRCEAATGADPALVVEVFRAIGAPVPFQFASKMVALTYDERENCYFAPVGDMRVRYEPPAYTSDLNAAVLLVPEGCLFAIRTLWDGPIVAGYAHVRTYSYDAEECDGKRHLDDYTAIAATAALALTAAALRARASLAREQSA